jgi:hypothetical protein
VRGSFLRKSTPLNSKYSLKERGSISKLRVRPLKAVAISALNNFALEPVTKIFFEYES